MASNAHEPFRIKHHRDDYAALLAVPDGYELNCLLGTTFGLDLGIARHLILTAGGGPQFDRNDVPRETAVLEQLTRFAGRILIVCNKGQCYRPSGRHSKVDALLGQFVFEIAVPDATTCFHPKILVQRFCAKTDGTTLPPIIRATVLSRNLTNPSELHLELQFTAEGLAYENDSGNERFNGRLAKFIAEVLDATDHGKKDCFEHLVSQVKKCKFWFPEGVDGDSVTFLANSGKNQINLLMEMFLRAGFDGESRASFVVSPFLTESQLELLNPVGVISSPKGFQDTAKYFSEHLDSGHRYFVVDCGDPEAAIAFSEAEGEEKRDEEQADAPVQPDQEVFKEPESDDFPRKLHAKLLLLENGEGKVFAALGSSNFTHNGMCENWEANVFWQFKGTSCKSATQIFDSILYHPAKEGQPPATYGIFRPLSRKDLEKPESAPEDLQKSHPTEVHALKCLATYSLMKESDSPGVTRLRLGVSFEPAKPSGKWNELEVSHFLYGAKSFQQDSGIAEYESPADVDDFVRVRVRSREKLEVELSFLIKVAIPYELIEARATAVIQRVLDAQSDFSEIAFQALARCEGRGPLRHRASGQSKGGGTKTFPSLVSSLSVETILQLLTSSPAAFQEFEKINDWNNKRSERCRDAAFRELWQVCREAYCASALMGESRAKP